MTDHDELDPFIAEIARELKRPVHFDASFDERVMEALVPAVVPISTRRVAQPWYRRTFAFSVSQIGGLAAAAALVGIVAVNLINVDRSATGMVATVPEGTTLQPVADVTREKSNAPVLQQFLVVIPSASSVSLVGEFNDWDASRTPMERVSHDGAWSITIPLTPGRYEYQFELDGGRRVTDPTRPQTSSDFGSPNSVITVEPRD